VIIELFEATSSFPLYQFNIATGFDESVVQFRVKVLSSLLAVMLTYVGGTERKNVTSFHIIALFSVTLYLLFKLCLNINLAYYKI
jgi:hypothetical protein